MANKRSRKSKLALNIIPVKPVLGEVEVNIEKKDVESIKKLHNINIINEVKEMITGEMSVSSEDINLKNIPEENVTPELIGDDSIVFNKEDIETESPIFEIEEDEIEEKPERTIKSLTTREYKLFQRTGMMPK